MKKNAFTLVELIVAIAIMSIVLVLAISSIGAISERNARKRYENYGETLVSSGKLYTDSNAIDMFGYESDGCFDIYFDALKEKKLAKDIDYKEVSCADGGEGKTYVKVRKLDGEIKYQLSMVCRDEKGEIVYDDLIDSSDILCDGRAPHTGPEITVSPEKQEEYLSENETYKVSIKIHDDDGLLENNEVEYSWCKDAGCTDVISTTRLRYENKRDADIKTVNKKIPRPKGDGEYYLKVKSVKVVDIFNNATTYEKIFGPYRFDITPPVVQVKAYKRSGTEKTGGEVGSATFNPKQLMSDKKYSVTGTISSKYENNYSGWLNKANYPDGIYYEITYSDNIQVKDEKWEYNASNLKYDDAGSTSLTKNSSNTLNKASGVIDEYLEADGYRKGRITIRDLAGNYVKVNLEAYIDKTPPTAPSITNPTHEKWVNYSFSITLKSTDAMSGIKKYQYSYNSTNKTWVNYDNSDSVEFETTEFSQERNEAAFVRSMDVAGNYSAENSTGIKIDKTKPNCTSYTDNNSTTWVNRNVYIYKGCQDTGTVQSGCEKEKYVEHTINYSKTTHTFESYTIKDNAGNEKSCPSVTVNTYVDKDPPTCHHTTDYTSPDKVDRYISGWCEDNGSNQSGCTKTTWVDYTGTQTEQAHTLPAYTISDNAGNTENCPSYTINMLIDKTPPRCTHTADFTSWTNQSRTIQKGCADDQGTYNSNCTSSVNVERVISSSKTTHNFTAYTISDNAGNTVNCPAVSVNVLVDTDVPSCSVSGGTDWVTNGVDLTVSCSDSGGSGLSRCTNQYYDDSQNSKSETKNNVKENKNYHVADNAGNSNTCPITVSSKKQRDTWNSCKTGENTCAYGCDTCTDKVDLSSREEAENCTANGGSVHTASGFGQCWTTRSCNCSNCHTGHNTCAGGWNDSWADNNNCVEATNSVRCRTVYKR